MDAINTETDNAVDLFSAGEGIPQIKRAPKANPYAGLVKALAEDMTKHQTATLPYKAIATRPEGELDEKQEAAYKKAAADRLAVEEIIRLAQKAGKDYSSTEHPNGVTIRKEVTPDGKGKAVLKLWAVERITREGKDADE